MALNLLENYKISVQSIKSNKMRTILTMVIIVIGIFALIGSLIAIDAIKGSINTSFTSMGANTFSIRNREINIRIGTMVSDQSATNPLVMKRRNNSKTISNFLLQFQYQLMPVLLQN